MMKHTQCFMFFLLLVFLTPSLVRPKQITPDSFKKPSSYHDSMFFYITSVHIDNGFNETHLVSGDKIGIFDTSDQGDTICVGMREIDEMFAQGYFPPEWLTMVATRDLDNNEDDVPETGFVAGHTPIFAVYKAQDDEVYVLKSNEVLTDSPTGEKVGAPPFEPEGKVTIRIYGGSHTPVELTFFKLVSSQERSALLSWQTASETHNFGFQIERMCEKNSGNWEVIGFVPGNGTSSEQHSYQFVDEEELPAGTYFYRLKQMDTDGNHHYSDVQKRTVQAPHFFTLKQNYPNPFNPQTTIEFQLKNDGYVSIVVYDIHGRKIDTLVDGDRDNGHHRISFNAEKLSAGTYFYEMQAGNYNKVRKMTVLK